MDRRVIFSAQRSFFSYLCSATKWSYSGGENDLGLSGPGTTLGWEGPPGAGGLCCSMVFWNHVVNSKTSYEKIMIIYCLFFCSELLFLWTLNIIQYYCRWTACLWYPIKASSGMNSYLLSSWIWLSRFVFFFFECSKLIHTWEDTRNLNLLSYIPLRKVIMILSTYSLMVFPLGCFLLWFTLNVYFVLGHPF